jgi:ComF family protein
MKLSPAVLSPLIHLFYPHNCLGCGSDIVEKENFICLECINNLPHTGFATHANNPVEKLFWGRIPVAAGMSEFYFSKDSIVQNLIHEFKYRANRKVGLYLGKLIGKSLLQSGRFDAIDALVPLPLFAQKEFKRGYNQSAILCAGISEIMSIPVLTKNIIRIVHTETQTKKSRIQRWENVEKSFSVLKPADVEGKHILLVDDVITTGATLEACGAEILKAADTTLSIATLAMATK